MKSIYWVSTLLLSVFLIWSSYTYIFNKQTIEGIKELGFPDYFRIQLAVLKIVAVILILIPQIPFRIKEWAYVGIGLFFVTAIVAHFANKDSIIINLINVFLIIILVVSYVYLYKVN